MTVCQNVRSNMAKGKELVRGEAASPGVVVVTVRVVDKDPEKMADIAHGEVMVAERTVPENVIHMKRASALVTDVGGLTSHTAIVAREWNIPAVVGTMEGTSILKDGQKVVVDGTEGAVYEYIEEAPPKPVSIADKMQELAAKKGITIDPAFLAKMKRRE